MSRVEPFAGRAATTHGGGWRELAARPRRPAWPGMILRSADGSGALPARAFALADAVALREDGTAAKPNTRAIERLAEAGLARRDLDPALAARAVLEMLARMAMRRPHDPSPPPGDDNKARTTTLVLAEAALAPRGGGTTTITPGLRRGRRRSRRDASP